LTGISASNKTYDATTAATLTGTTGVNAIGADVVSVSGTGVGTFADKNVGVNKAVTVSGYTLSGIDAGNYNILQPTGLTASIAQKALAITANNASKTVGQSIDLSGYTTSGLVGNDSINAVSLSSLGQPTTAAVGNYAIVASDAIGEALSNYAISYQDGSLLVNAAAISPTTTTTTASSHPYISVLASNGQGVSTQAPQQASEPDVKNPQTLMTNPLAEVTNLQVINQGIRLPEGI
jgi:hypothetical protein